MRRPQARLIAVLAFVMFGVFFLYPAATVLRQAFHGPDGFTLRFFTAIFSDSFYREGIANSFLLGIGATALALLIAFPLALVSHRHDFIGKNVLSVLILAPMILPPFVGAVGVKQILGVNGALNAALAALGWMDAAKPFDWLAEARVPGIIAMIALNLYPVLYMNIATALANIDPAMEQAAETLGCPPWKRFFRITLPLAMPGVFAGSSIVFIWAFTELGVPLVFDFSRTAPVQIFDGLKGLDHNPLPYALAAVLLLSSIAVFAIAKSTLGRMTSGTAPRPVSRATVRPLSRGKSAACAGFFLAIFLLAILPHAGVILLSLAGRWYGTIVPEELTFRHYLGALGDQLVVPSIQNSLAYAGAATLLAAAAGLAIAWVIVRSDLKIRSLLDAIVMLPLAVPGLIMAFGYLALSQEGKPFHFLLGPGGNPFFLLVLAYATRRLPYIVRSAVAGLQQSNPALEEAARSLGAPPSRVLRRIAIPLIAANLAAGAILTFAFSMLEVSDSLILAQRAGHFPITKTIYTLLNTLGNGTELAAALGVWAMAFLSIAIFGAALIGGKRGGMFTAPARPSGGASPQKSRDG